MTNSSAHATRTGVLCGSRHIAGNGRDNEGLQLSMSDFFLIVPASDFATVEGATSPREVRLGNNGAGFLQTEPDEVVRVEGAIHARVMTGDFREDSTM